MFERKIERKRAQRRKVKARDEERRKGESKKAEGNICYTENKSRAYEILKVGDPRDTRVLFAVLCMRR